MIKPLERIRASVCDLIEQAAAELERERLECDRHTAAAIEHATSAAATAAAYQQGRDDERRRIQALLQHQRETLGRGGINAISLATLSRVIEE